MKKSEYIIKTGEYFKSFKDKDLTSLERLYASNIRLTDWVIDVTGKEKVLMVNKDLFKNDFKLEVSGSKGSVVVEGLTKWGYQRTTLYKRKYPSGYPNETFFEFKGDDETWKKECIDFAQRIKNNDLEKIIQENSVGRVVTNHSVKLLVDIINELLNNSFNADDMKKRCQKLHKELFSTEKVVKQIAHGLD